MSLIELSNVSKVYQMTDDNTFIALDSISLNIEKGEYVAIVGPSGSGKSTLLQILGLLDSPTSGTYKVLNHDTSTLSDNQITKIRSKFMGFIFQFFNLLPRVTSKENTILPMIYTGEEFDPAKAEDILKQLGMENHLTHTSSQLSGGQQQRVAIARALINKPDIIFADEPTGNLPQKQAVEIFEELEKLHKNGITLIVITHSEKLANRADRIIKIVDGKIVEDTKKKHMSLEKNIPSTTTEDLEKRKFFNAKLWTQTSKIALQSLMSNKIRTFLTMLGIIIGVFSVISMLAIGKGAQKSVEYELRSIGSNMFRVKSEWPKIKGVASHQRTITRINARDLKALQELQKNSPHVKSVAASYEGHKTLSYKGYSYSTKVFGVSPSFREMRGNYPELGRFFTEGENLRQERVCVLGKTVYENLFKGSQNPIGQSVKIDQKKYRIIGLLPAKGANWTGNIDDIVYIPVETAINRLYGGRNYNFFFVQSTDEESLPIAMDEVSQVLRKNHRIAEGVENDFTIRNYGEMKQTIDQISGKFFTLIVLIALISLIVGGIGIMNIMLVSVTERTREIGIRKAIGARRNDILSQFLVESIFISFLGSSIGVFLAYLLCLFLRNLLLWEIVFEIYSVLLAFGFAVFVGLFFGLYPAKKAADLSPIKALRYE